ncbi:MAG: protein kinase [Deltaproteobacteria bacterium]|nr:protein kinase [Deltaproteobacteria bacterium]
MTRQRPASSRGRAPEPSQDEDELETFGADGEATIAAVDGDADQGFGFGADATIAQDEPFQEATPIADSISPPQPPAGSAPRIAPLDTSLGASTRSAPRGPSAARNPPPPKVAAREAPRAQSGARLQRKEDPSPFSELTPIQTEAATGDLAASVDEAPFEEPTPFGDDGGAAGFDDDEATAMDTSLKPKAPVPKVVDRPASRAKEAPAAQKRAPSPPRAAPAAKVVKAAPQKPADAEARLTDPPRGIRTVNHTEAEFNDRFTVGPPVGSGGMAEVRLGYERLDDGDVRPCVLKRIAREYAKQPKYREMFTEEVRLSRLLDHPNVVRAYSDGEVDTVPYIIFELIDGVTLKDFQRLAGEPLPPAVAAEIAIEVTNGLTYAHNAMGEDGEPMKLVHRDVSPQNILISRRCEVKLVDFGIARFEGRMHSTISGEVKGKMKYMALEQLAEKPVDGRADIFALGIVIAEVLGILKEGFTEHFVSGLDSNPRHVPKPLYDLLKKMTAPKAEGRPANGDVLLAELVRVHAQLPRVTLEEFAARAVFPKHKSILDKSAAPAPKSAAKPAPKAAAPRPVADVETDFDGGGADFDADSEATQGYAEFLAAGHMPALPGQPQSGASVLKVELRAEQSQPDDEPEEPTPPPEPPKAKPPEKRALVEPTARVRTRSEAGRGAEVSVGPASESSSGIVPRGVPRGGPLRPAVERATPRGTSGAPAAPGPAPRGTSGGLKNPLDRGPSGPNAPLPGLGRTTSGGAPNPMLRPSPGGMPPGMPGMPGMPGQSLSLSGIQLPPGVNPASLTPEMLAELSRRSAMAQSSSGSKLIWIIATVLTALALVVLGIAVALKLRPVPAESTPAQTQNQPSE